MLSTQQASSGVAPPADPGAPTGVELAVGFSSGGAANNQSASACSATDFSQEDWRVVVESAADGAALPHLLLADSLLVGLPLSSEGPLLACEACDRITLRNVTFAGLAPPSLGPGSPAYAGAFAAYAVTAVQLDLFSCSNVTGALGWACLLLMFRAAAGDTSSHASFQVRDSVVRGNSVAAPPAAADPLQAGAAFGPRIQSALLGPGSGSGSSASQCAASYGTVVLAPAEAEPAPAVEVVLQASAMEGNTGGCGAALAAMLPLAALQLIGSRLANNTAAQSGGAVYVQALAAPGLLTLSNLSAVDGNTAVQGSGGAVFVSEAAQPALLALTGASSLSGNSAGTNGGAIATSGATRVSISDGSAASHNTAQGSGGPASGNGGAFYIAASCRVELQANSSAISNLAVGNGGTAACHDSSGFEVSDGSTVLYNVARADGGVLWCWSLAQMVVSGGSRVDKNSADTGGGAVYVSGGSSRTNLTVSFGSSLSGNTASVGGAFATFGNASVLVSDNSSLSGNTALLANGGALYVGISCYVQVSRNSLAMNNTAVGASAMGGMAACSECRGLLVNGNSAVSRNAAGYKGGVLWCLTLASLTVADGSSMDDNSAGNAGGVAYVAGERAAQLGLTMAVAVMDNSTMSRNTAAVFGGAMAAALATNITVSDRSTVAGNVATAGNGGAFFMTSVCSLAIALGSTASGNSASGQGGLLSCDSISGVAVSDASTVARNSAGLFGGAVASNSTLPTFTISNQSSVSNNTAGHGGGAVCVQGALSTTALSVAFQSALSSNRAGADGSSQGANGGALLTLGRLSSIAISNGSTMSGNVASALGGAVFAALGDCGAVVVSGGSAIVDNRGEGYVGALLCATASSSSVVVDKDSVVAYSSSPTPKTSSPPPSSAPTTPSPSSGEDHATQIGPIVGGVVGGVVFLAAMGAAVAWHRRRVRTLAPTATPEPSTHLKLSADAAEADGQQSRRRGRSLLGSSHAFDADPARSSRLLGMLLHWAHISRGASSNLRGNTGNLSSMQRTASAGVCSGELTVGPTSSGTMTAVLPAVTSADGSLQLVVQTCAASMDAAPLSAIRHKPAAATEDGLVAGHGGAVARHGGAEKRHRRSAEKGSLAAGGGAGGQGHGGDQEAAAAAARAEGKASPPSPESPPSTPGKTALPAELLARMRIKISPDELVLREQLGSGMFGDVHKAMWRGTPVAVKLMGLQNMKPQEVARCKAEVEVMCLLRHPNIVQLLGAAIMPSGHLAIVMELVARGSLHQLLHVGHEPLNARKRLRMALDAAKGLEYLHGLSPPLVHRDIKSLNLLVAADWSLKVCDFGMSKFMHSANLSTNTMAGTPAWMAPEVLLGRLSDEKGDVYSFGMVLYELATDQVPWHGLQHAFQLLQLVGHQGERPPLPDGLDPGFVQLIRRCWHQDPAARPSFSEVVRALRGMQELRPVTAQHKPGTGDEVCTDDA